MGSNSKKIIAASIAVVAACILVNIALWLLPKPGEGQEDGTGSAPIERVSGGTGDASGVEGTEDPESADDAGGKVEIDEGVIPVPEDLPEGADPAAFKSAVREYLEGQKGYGVPQSITIEMSGTLQGVAGDGGDIPYWYLRADYGEGTEIPVTVQYESGTGFTAGTY